MKTNFLEASKYESPPRLMKHSQASRSHLNDMSRLVYRTFLDEWDCNLHQMKEDVLNGQKALSKSNTGRNVLSQNPEEIRPATPIGSSSTPPMK